MLIYTPIRVLVACYIDKQFNKICKYLLLLHYSMCQKGVWLI